MHVILGYLEPADKLKLRAVSKGLHWIDRYTFKEIKANIFARNPRCVQPFLQRPVARHMNTLEFIFPLTRRGNRGPATWATLAQSLQHLAANQDAVRIRNLKIYRSGMDLFPLLDAFWKAGITTVRSQNIFDATVQGRWKYERQARLLGGIFSRMEGLDVSILDTKLSGPFFGWLISQCRNLKMLELTLPEEPFWLPPKCIDLQTISPQFIQTFSTSLKEVTLTGFLMQFGMLNSAIFDPENPIREIRLYHTFLLPKNLDLLKASAEGNLYEGCD